ncbi:SusC/RagA family TonB-linked outer membrane protein [Riemerella anatipestifer]|uniref:SusC/RagA family TonB-linked outer membrane protein n=1 Tax=Riemerella anatipestifer TaxID=34085 RepID=UPI001AD72765|nr:SusC/RagA family TonB-linked outer membrane protein [Riemerella anatipestifer]MBO4233803.1 SusC/RagA family TonB-linked outer membrane protein [Riemerella anatipestifer]MDY3344618.1 SusC/RagA family TonB-linked outer membrane protein [Riemerella anatipestifer]MDY3357698.1 SusC/RagA family TonB-linked outer membrane protein [Riemerella anatipestifer]
MKKLTTSVLAVVLTSSFVTVDAQKVKKDSAKTTEIEGVVMTALGIKREKKALGYQAQEVSGSLLTDSRQTNAVGALSGNVAGVQVTAPSSMGGSTKISIRGINSITGNNKPLIVVDGIPLDNSNYNGDNTAAGYGGRDYGDASADVNPDDIESVTVLKGGPASALYGSRAANGVIMYTTKRAKFGKTSITFNTGLTLESINVMPRLQKEYGGGVGATLPKVTINGRQYNIARYAVDESWGPKYNPNLMYLPWNAFDPEFPDQYLKEVPWVAPQHDVEDFFRTGVTYNNSISLSKSFSGTNVRLSLANVKTEGILPNSRLERSTLGFNMDSKLTEDLSMNGTFNYVITNGFNRPEQGYSDNSVAQKFFQWGQRQLDMAALRDYKMPNGRQRPWNRTSYLNPTPKYADNPYWTVYENTADDRRNRFYGNFGLKYEIAKGLYATGNVYGDTYSLEIQQRQAVGSQSQSYYEIVQRNFTEFNYEGRLHYDTKFLNDFSVSSFVGVNRRENKYSALSGKTNGGLVVPGLYNLGNGYTPSTVTNYQERRRVNSIFGSVSLGYKNLLFIDGTLRRDDFSTVSRGQTYPSLTGSFVFSDLVKASWLNYGKLRAGWAKTANDTSPYSLETYLDTRQPFYFPRFSYPGTQNNPDLIPEQRTIKEIGLEVSMFKKRFGFDITYYRSVTTDLLTPVQVDPSTGNTSIIRNAGSMENKGIEAIVNLTPIKTENFSWDLTWNFAKNNNKLLSLYGDNSILRISNVPFGLVSIEAVKGERYGQIYGTDFTYDANGNKVVDEKGYYVPSEIKSLGSIIPDYNMGIRSTFKYKSFVLSALVDRQKGGNYYSISHMWGMYSGMLEETAANGIRETGVVNPGVKADGTPNDVVISAQDWGASHYGTVAAMNVFDASYWKLREVTLSYSLPKSVIGPFQGVTVSAFGRNLLTWGLAWKSFDPEMASYSSGNIQGIEGGSLPSTRTYGVNVQFKF